MTSLNGAKILVTRPRSQAANLCDLIKQHHGCPVAFPTIEIVPAADPEKIRATLSTMTHFQWVVFISANAVNFALQAIDGKIGVFDGVKTAAIGPATAKALFAAGLTVDLAPETGADSIALLASPTLQTVAGQRFLIVRGASGLETLSSELLRRGAKVEYLDVYRRMLPEVDAKPVRTLLENDQLAMITATSGETLLNFLALLGENSRHKAFSVPVITVSERIRLIAEKAGFKKVLVAESPSDSAIVKTIIISLTGAQRGRFE